MNAFLSGEFWALVGVIGGIYSILGLCIQVQFGITGLMILAQTAYMAVSAYTMAILVVDAHLNLFLSMLIAVGATMLFALITTLPAVRLRGDYLAIFTLAAAEIVRHLARNLDDLTGGAQGSIAISPAGSGIQFDETWRSFENSVSEILEGLFGGTATHDITMLWIVWSVFLVVSVPLAIALRSPWGRVARAIREDDEAAAALGKRITTVKLQAGMIGGALGALAGLLFAVHFGFFVPDDFAPVTLLYVWTAVILGGLGRWWTVPVGALTFGGIFASTRFLSFPPFDLLDAAERAYVRFIVVGALIMALMAFRPQGMLGKREDIGFRG